MMYNSKLVSSIKANGKILREFKDTVYINFGAEYASLLKILTLFAVLLMCLLTALTWFLADLCWELVKQLILSVRLKMGI